MSERRYLFIVPQYAEPVNLGEDDPWDNYDRWQIATRDGKVITTTITNHFSGKMPIIEAGEIFLNTVPNEDIMVGISQFKDGSDE